MPEHQLERVMLDFVNHQFDILLSTTIVESGLDIPNANRSSSMKPIVTGWPTSTSCAAAWGDTSTAPTATC